MAANLVMGIIDFSSIVDPRSSVSFLEELYSMYANTDPACADQCMVACTSFQP